MAHYWEQMRPKERELGGVESGRVRMGSLREAECFTRGKMGVEGLALISEVVQEFRLLSRCEGL